MLEITPQLGALVDEAKKGNIVFLMGNGINRYNDSSDSRSWNDLLIKLFNKYSTSKIEELYWEGITYTEYFDLIFLNSNQKYRSEIQSSFANLMESWKHSPHHESVIGLCRDNKFPIITTNFDKLFAEAIGADLQFTLKDRKKGFSDFYPWQAYHANEPITDVLNDFGIWYAHGFSHYKRSIKLGLSDYMGNVGHAKKMLPIKKGKYWDFPGENTWMNPLFNKSIVIIGLGLNENEVFLRWLLLQRAHYHKSNPSKACKGWYLNVGPPQEGGQFFLQNIGIETIQMDSFDELYNDFWTIF